MTRNPIRSSAVVAIVSLAAQAGTVCDLRGRHRGTSASRSLAPPRAKIHTYHDTLRLSPPTHFSPATGVNMSG